MDYKSYAYQIQQESTVPTDEYIDATSGGLDVG